MSRFAAGGIYEDGKGRSRCNFKKWLRATSKPNKRKLIASRPRKFLQISHKFHRICWSAETAH